MATSVFEVARNRSTRYIRNVAADCLVSSSGTSQEPIPTRTVVTTPLLASSTAAGSLISTYTFEVPPYQREYSWEDDELTEFWTDLQAALEEDSYFLGLVILTDNNDRKQVVDGQQRILTLTILAAALHHEAIKRKRTALADRIQADFLSSIDYNTDETHPRVILSDDRDNATLRSILENEISEENTTDDEELLSTRMRSAYFLLRKNLQADLKHDAFKRLGQWADFITNKIYFAVFLHPNASSAYRVFEVINTRGRELTTADLIKNYLISQTTAAKRKALYSDWKNISRQFSPTGSNSFVQYIRHAITIEVGHILPKDLFDFVAERVTHSNKQAPTPSGLMQMLQQHLPLYSQMVDPSLDGPADSDELRIFAALNSLQVIAVRPILLAVAERPGAIEAMKYVLRLVVRRIVVGNLGTGNVERRFGEAAKRVYAERNWKVLLDDLRDLNPTREEFIYQLHKRSFNKSALAFLRRSTLAGSMTPDEVGTLHFIHPKQGADWEGFSEEDATYWGSTIGNTYLSTLDRRPKGASTWTGFKQNMLPTGIVKELSGRLSAVDTWDASAVDSVGQGIAKDAADVWY